MLLAGLIRGGSGSGGDHTCLHFHGVRINPVDALHYNGDIYYNGDYHIVCFRKYVYTRDEFITSFLCRMRRLKPGRVRGTVVANVFS